VAPATAFAFTGATSSLNRTHPHLLPLLLTSLSPQRRCSVAPPQAAAPPCQRQAPSPSCHSPIPLAHGSASTSAILCARSHPRFCHGKTKAGVSPPR
jgi:hypothetical protein